MSHQYRRPLYIFFICFLAVIFALQWGPGAKGCGLSGAPSDQDAVIATVNGVSIPRSEYTRAFSERMQQLRGQYGGMTEDLAKQLGLPKQILDGMISEKLLSQAAEKAGISTSDEEIQKFLAEAPAFLKDGKFDIEAYRKFCEFMQKTPSEFEGELRQQLAAQKLLAAIENGVQASEDEVRTRYFKEYNLAQVTFVRFLPSMFSDKVGQLSEAEVKAYASNNASAISAYYEANKFRYHQPEQVRARHILIKLSTGASAEQKEAAKSKLSALRETIAAGKDFAEVAKENSDDSGSKQNGGDLGYNERNSPMPPFSTPAFSTAAFALSAGELSQPVETPLGFHLIKLEDKKAPITQTLETATDSIARELLMKQKTRDLAKSAAEQALLAIKDGKKKLADLYPPEKESQSQAMRFETESKPEAIESGEFNAGADTLPRLGPAPELIKAIMMLSAPATLSRPYEVGDGFVAAVVTARDVPTEAAYKEKRDTVRKETLQARRYDVRTQYSESLRKGANVVVNDASLR